MVQEQSLPSMEEARVFVQELKKKLIVDDDKQEIYDGFSSLVKAFGAGMISSASLASMLESLFQTQKGLLVEFLKFLPENLKSESMAKRVSLGVAADDDLAIGSGPGPGISSPGIKKKKKLSRKLSRRDDLRLQHAIEFLKRVKKHSEDENIFRGFLSAMSKYLKSGNRTALEKEVSVLFRNNPELEIEFLAFLTDEVNDDSRTEIPSLEPVSSDENNQSSTTREREEEELPPREKIEEDMFEQDMLMHRIEAALGAAKRLLVACQENPGNKIEVDAYMNVINLRCIEHMYGDSGLELVELLRDRPETGSLLIVSRLSEKYEEIKYKMAKANSAMAEEIRKIHDSRSNEQHILKIL